jgi:hypothetical protein
MLAVIGAGGDKTNLVRFVAAQQLRHRWPASFVDLRRQHGWASGLLGVDLWTSVEHAEAGLVGLGDELKRRTEKPGGQHGQRLLIIDDIDLLLPSSRPGGALSAGPAIQR